MRSLLLLLLLFAACSSDPAPVASLDGSTDALALDLPSPPDTSPALDVIAVDVGLDAGIPARVCVPGAQVACACVGGGQGAQVCAADGQSLGACACPDAGSPAVDAGIDSGINGGVDGGSPDVGFDAVNDVGAGADVPDVSDGGTDAGADVPHDVLPDACVSTTVGNCCGVACGTLANSNGVACVAGRCVYGACDTGFGDCDGDPTNGCEVSLRSNHANCGACGAACASGRVCAGTACVPCPTGQTACGDRCVDTQIDVANCGTCGQVCPTPSNASAACVESSCRLTCEAGFADCDSTLSNGCEVNTRTSNANCGTCGHVCPLGFTCRGGNCSL